MLPAWSELDPLLSRVAREIGTPSYVYVTERIEERRLELERNFGAWFKLSYAVKCNPNTALLAFMFGKIPYLDVSSIGEVRRATRAGWDAGLLSFTGPAKREAELEEAIATGVGELVIESLEEAQAASVIAQRLGVTQNILVRLSPDHVPKGFGDHMAGRPSPFGIDVEEAEITLPQIAALPGLTIVGFHIYSGTQSLRAEAVVENWQNFIRHFREASALLDIAPKRLVFGSGLGIPHHDNDVALDTAAIAAAIAGDLDGLRQEARFAQTEFVLELGRHLIGEAGVFLTRVLRVKSSRGSQIALCDGGMNAHLAATGQFGMVLRRNYKLHCVGKQSAEGAKVDLHGPLCTSIDRLAANALLPQLAAGDIIAIYPSGAYGPSSSPSGFISHPAVSEVLVSGDILQTVTE